jgi:hypothetical protein
MTDYPITPPPELLQQWFEQHYDYDKGINELLIEAAQYGADQELQACCEWVKSKQTYWAHDELRATRRPKPPSLKDQALQALAEADLGSTEAEWSQRFDTIRRALEQLND